VAITKVRQKELMNIERNTQNIISLRLSLIFEIAFGLETKVLVILNFGVWVCFSSGDMLVKFLCE
jgi:hypothetical protein